MAPQDAMDHLLKLGEQTQTFYAERKSSGHRAAAGRLSAVKGDLRVAGAGYRGSSMPSGMASAGKVPRYTPEDRKMLGKLDERLHALLLELDIKREAGLRRAQGLGADGRRVSSIGEMRKAEARRAQDGQEGQTISHGERRIRSFRNGRRYSLLRPRIAAVRGEHAYDRQALRPEDDRLTEQQG